MKSDWSALEPARLRDGTFASNTGDTFGAFRFIKGSTLFQVIAADGVETGWEHVSMTISYGQPGKKRTMRLPTWEEMSWLKSLFWEASECVVQFHPPESEYVNNHPTCLHLWKSVNENFPMPPSILVGIKPSIESKV